jgi:hypothetical protein
MDLFEMTAKTINPESGRRNDTRRRRSRSRDRIDRVGWHWQRVCDLRWLAWRVYWT